MKTDGAAIKRLLGRERMETPREFIKSLTRERDLVTVLMFEALISDTDGPHDAAAVGTAFYLGFRLAQNERRHEALEAAMDEIDAGVKRHEKN